MATSKSEGLASGREPRIKKATARAQQLLEEQQQRVARRKSKAATKVVSQPKLVDNEGDGFMYGPAESYAAPTLTDDDLDRLRFEAAEAKHILKLLAHRGDGDWQVQYQERQIDLETLRQARDNPDSNVLERTAGGLPPGLAKGKGRAVNEDEDDGVATSSHRETNYTGITIGRSPPTAATSPTTAIHTHKREDHIAMDALHLAYLPPSPPPKAKHRAPSRSPSRTDQPAAKKPRIEGNGEPNPKASNAPAKRWAPGTAIATSKKATAKLSYGGPRPSTSLHILPAEISTHRRTISGVSQGEPPNKPPIKPSIQERPEPDHLGLPRKESRPHKSDYQPNNDRDRLYSIPPQPRPRVHQPTSIKTNPIRRSNPNTAPQALVPGTAAPSEPDHDIRPPHEQARPTAAAQPSPAHGQGGREPPGMSPQLVHELLAHAAHVAEPRFSDNRSENRSDPIPKPTLPASKRRGPPRNQLQAPPAKLPTPKKHTAPRPDPIRDRALNMARGCDGPHGRVDAPLAGRHAPKPRGSLQPKSTHTRAGNASRKRGDALGQPDEPPVAPPADHHARDTQSPEPNAQGPQRNGRAPAASDSDNDGQAGEAPHAEDDEGGGEQVQRHRVVSKLTAPARNLSSGLAKAVNTTPTVNSYPLNIQPIIKLTARRSKPWIIARGTFDWRVGDPGKKVLTSDEIVAHFFARACLELERQVVFRDDHVKTVNILITTYRNHTKSLIVTAIYKHAGFVDGRPKFNRELMEWFLPDAFHEADPESEGDRCPFESELVRKCIASTLFGRNKIGIKHDDQFNPIPLRYLAFICAIMNHVIYCYRTGYFNNHEQLEAAQQEVAFRQYLADLCDMQANRPNALKKLCGTLYDDARMEASRAKTRAEGPRQPRMWAPDIPEEYISQFRVPTPELNDTEDELPPARHNHRDNVDQHRMARPRSRAGSSPIPRPRHGKGIQLADPSDDEPDPPRSQQHRRPHSDALDRRQAPSRTYAAPQNGNDDDEDRGEGPSRPYGVRPVSDDDEDDRGEGPSRPHGTHHADDSNDDELPSPRRAFLRKKPRDPEESSTDPEEGWGR